MKKNKLIMAAVIVFSLITVTVLFFIDPDAPGAIGNLFAVNLLTMLKILPFAFILIALFDIWVERETIEKHLGEGGGAISFFWAVLLGSTTMGPMILCLPVAAALYRKGARLTVIFTYIAASSVARVAMTIFESSYMGVKFTIIRYAVSLPLIVGSSILLGRALQRRGYEIKGE